MGSPSDLARWKLFNGRVAIAQAKVPYVLRLIRGIAFSIHFSARGGVMKRTLLLTVILIIGLLASQLAPMIFGPLASEVIFIRQFLTMWLLSYIMIEVGREFQIDLKNKRQYAVDYGVAATAAAFPWILVTAYFLFFLMPEKSSTGNPLWIEALLAGRFAAPTSAGVLFSMLAAAGLSGTWAYRKTRILAIFDDLDTVLLLIPLQALMVGLAWQLGGVLAALFVLIALGIRYYRKLNWPTSWAPVLAYAFAITAISELLYAFTKDPSTNVGLHIEVLLPAFLVGCALKTHPHEAVTVPGEDEPGLSAEEKAGLSVSSIFMFLVGFSMPQIFGLAATGASTMSPFTLAVHVAAVTVLSNIGKMFACLCYKKEASFRERLAVSIAMFPRGEVGAGVLAVALGYGISGPFVTVAFLSLALNLTLTGGFIYVVKVLLQKSTEASAREAANAYAR